MTVEKLLQQGSLQEIKRFIAENDLTLDGDRLVPKSENGRQKLKALAELYDQRQLAKKILL